MKKYIITNAEGIESQQEVTTRTMAVMAAGEDKMQVSDTFHTMDELYDHRITLFIALCRIIDLHDVGHYIQKLQVWRSKKHADGQLCFGTGTQYVLGIEKEAGKIITYHIPIERWDETDFAETLERAPEFDGHTSDDVLERLKAL